MTNPPNVISSDPLVLDLRLATRVANAPMRPETLGLPVDVGSWTTAWSSPADPYAPEGSVPTLSWGRIWGGGLGWGAVILDPPTDGEAAGRRVVIAHANDTFADQGDPVTIERILPQLQPWAWTVHHLAQAKSLPPLGDVDAAYRDAITEGAGLIAALIETASTLTAAPGDADDQQHALTTLLTVGRPVPQSIMHGWATHRLPVERQHGVRGESGHVVEAWESMVAGHPRVGIEDWNALPGPTQSWAPARAAGHDPSRIAELIALASRHDDDANEGLTAAVRVTIAFVAAVEPERASLVVRAQVSPGDPIATTAPEETLRTLAGLA